ncbi:MAG: class I SAM-dependent RNA methyltransferase [Lachnospiraceae bacterium]|nr:class I SAM-dependent RNA methyltransferase [Lachnospiraceae bacterium]
MAKVELIAPCHFGLEAVLKKEIMDLGYEIAQVEDGRVSFYGEPEAVCRANIFLRTAERVLLKVAAFQAETFDELFEKTKALPWEDYLPKDAKCWVTKAASVKSKLFSPSDIQRIMKKAIVERMKSVYNLTWLPEDGESYPLRVFLKKDEVTVALDTTGESLHKRGYRKLTAKAPIAENLAAALILLTPWKGDRILVDPFCGSGTIPIEAALIAANIAPGMERSFTAEDWQLVPKKGWYEAIDEANDLIDHSVKPDIQGYDLDEEMVSIARENARLAGVDHLIHFQKRDVKDLSHPKKYGFMITNPPYGERLEEKAKLFPLYQTLGERFKALDDWSLYVITSYEDTEKAIGRKADKNRKIYNGMLKTYYYSFMGKRPPKPDEGAKGLKSGKTENTTAMKDQSVKSTGKSNRESC